MSKGLRSRPSMRRSSGCVAWAPAGIEDPVTQSRALKQAIRRRMAETGEKYTEARRALLERTTVPQEESSAFFLFKAIVRDCFKADLVGSAPDFTQRSLEQLLQLARAAADLATWPDKGALEIRKGLSGQSPEARAWMESRLVKRESTQRETLDSLKEQKLDSWAEALRAELNDRRTQAEPTAVAAIDQAVQQIGFVLEHVPGSALRPAPEWDEELVPVAASGFDDTPFMVIVHSCGPAAIYGDGPIDFGRKSLDSLLEFAAAAGDLIKRPSEDLPLPGPERPRFRAWSEKLNDELDAKHVDFLRKLRDNRRLEDWGVELLAELRRRRSQAADVKGIDEACVRVESLRRHL